MTNILALWAVPRSTSTAFEWMMRQRGDMNCFHEPFGEAWYQGENPLWPRLSESSLRTPGLTLESVAQTLFNAMRNGRVFIKDFPHYINHMWNDDFLNRFDHSFLIRDPAKTITSMYNKWPDFHAKEVGFKEQRELFDRISTLHGAPPPVIDSDDLLENPQTMVRLWCEAVGIEFLPAALSWEPGARDEVSWWDGGSFHCNLRDSDGLKPQVRRYIELEDLPQRVKTVHAENVEHYEYLYAHRITS